MKKIVLSAAAAALTLAGVTASVVPALADPGNGNGAIVLHDTTCNLPVPKEGGGIYGSVPGERFVASSPSGTSRAHCRGEVPEAWKPSRAIRLDAACATTVPGLFVGEAVISVMPSGEIHGMCHVSNPD